MMNATYAAQYHAAYEQIDFTVKSLIERPTRALHLAIEFGGADALQALFDAVMDRGHRMVLVQVLNSPALPQWVRERLEAFLYGNRRPTAALLKQQLH